MHRKFFRAIKKPLNRLKRFIPIKRRRIYRGKPGGKWRYRRHFIPRSKWSDLMKELREKLRNPRFFENLEIVSPGKTVRKYWFEYKSKKGVKRIPVAIKDTGGNREQGYDFKGLRNGFLVHQRAVRGEIKGTGVKADKYRIKSPKVYGEIGNYLIMEFMKEIKREEIKKWPEKISNDFEEARYQMTTNFFKLEEKLPGYKRPQSSDVMTLGNTNPKNPEKGEWIFSIPYDYL